MTDTLNSAQYEAVHSTAKHILCLAGAGTGKTHSMIERICRLVSEGVDPKTILVLTFTNAAAFEMKSRFMKRMPGQRAPEFRTFHSFCYSLISTNRSVRNALGYKDIPIIATEANVRKIREMAAMQVGIKLPQGAFSKTKKVQLTLKEQKDLEIVNEAAERIMKKQGTITFDKLCYGVCQLFEAKDPCITKYAYQYEHLFVDEFQDTDEKQWTFVKSFVNADIFVVGDALQAIYGFRGADSSIIKSLASDPDWTVIKLTENYRSTKQICDFANRICSAVPPTYKVCIESNKQGFQVNLLDSADYCYGDVPEDDLEYAVEEYSNMGGTTAFLVRTNAEVDAIKRYLDEKKIVYSSGKRNIEAIHILRSAASNEYFLEWLSTYLNADMYAEYIRLSTIYSETNREYSIVEFAKDFAKVQMVQQRVAEVSEIRRILRDKKLEVGDRICKALKHLKFTAADSQNIIDSIEEGLSVMDTVEAVVDIISGEGDSALYVGTIHSVKGLEYDNVIIFNVGGPSFRLITEENRNLYYVGVTRAKSYCVIYQCV